MQCAFINRGIHGDTGQAMSIALTFFCRSQIVASEDEFGINMKIFD